jgi:hypothetical protein
MNMNRAWKYFTSYEGLQSLFIMNNDISVAAGTFVKLHRCQLTAPVGQAGVAAPVSDLSGVGAGLKYQIADGEWAQAQMYRGIKAPKHLRAGLPGDVGLWCGCCCFFFFVDSFSVPRHSHRV